MVYRRTAATYIFIIASFETNANFIIKLWATNVGISIYFITKQSELLIASKNNIKVSGLI